MWEVIVNRFKQGFRTLPYPKRALVFPKRFRGKPIICDRQGQFSVGQVDMGKLLFNEDFKASSSERIFTYSQDYQMAVSKKEDLIINENGINLALALNEKIRMIFGRSLKLRHVCAGSCNGCDCEIQAMNNVVFDLSRFGIQFVASPRHADGLMITGAVSKNMEAALNKTYEAVASPKIVIAVGACALSGGPFQGGSEVHNGVEELVPVDLYIPGCPPHPLTIIDGLLRLLGRYPQNKSVK